MEKAVKKMGKKVICLFISMVMFVTAISASFVTSAKSAKLSVANASSGGAGNVDVGGDIQNIIDGLKDDSGTSLYDLEFNDGTLSRADGSSPKYTYTDFVNDFKVSPDDIQIPDTSMFTDDNMYKQFVFVYSQMLGEAFETVNITLDEDDPVVTAKAALEKLGVVFPTTMTNKDNVYALLTFAAVSLSYNEYKLNVDIKSGMTLETAFANTLRACVNGVEQLIKQMTSFDITVPIPDNATPEQIVASVLSFVVNALKTYGYMIPGFINFPLASFSDIEFNVPTNPTFEQIGVELVRGIGKYLGYSMTLPEDSTFEQAMNEVIRVVAGDFGVSISAGSTYADEAAALNSNVDKIAKNIPDALLKILSRVMGTYTADKKGEDLFTTADSKGIFNDLNKMFNSDVTDYKVTLTKNASSITFKTRSNGNSVVTVNGKTVASDEDITVPLSGTNTPITIEVKNPTTSETKTYKVSVVQPAVNPTPTPTPTNPTKPTNPTNPTKPTSTGDKTDDNSGDGSVNGSSSKNPSTGDAVYAVAVLGIASAAAVIAFKKKKLF